MKPDVHPAYAATTVTCTCGNTFTTRSTADERHHPRRGLLGVPPFYTGKQKILDVGGRVEKFEKRYAKDAGKDKNS